MPKEEKEVKVEMDNEIVPCLKGAKYDLSHARTIAELKSLLEQIIESLPDDPEAKILMIYGGNLEYELKHPTENYVP